MKDRIRPPPAGNFVKIKITNTCPLTLLPDLFP
jgi:hypothetical protein